jgi:coproporphyrinogen III oxidase-like Fe-S oxidoreductase
MSILMGNRYSKEEIEKWSDPFLSKREVVEAIQKSRTADRTINFDMLVALLNQTLKDKK